MKRYQGFSTSAVSGSLTIAHHAMQLAAGATLKDKRIDPHDPVEVDRFRLLYRPQNLLAQQHLEVVQELFDVAVDPQESNNLAATMPDVADALGKQMQRYLEQCVKSSTVAGQKTLDAATIEQLRGIGYVK